eukprot:TRINITY_DN462_c0_g1_i1.p1 TRINITY_DN462_c0_g1~~TRINITY_DN462_c0_g1_i1.p1  ORF type:complete len:349 (+),score=172.88 TRINITY_DN462_c0_g1_i1:55-1047(+)
MTKLFCMGNPLLDISAHVDAALLEKYELKGGNAILAEEKHMPLYAELATKADVVYIPGGATLNSARVAKWVDPELSVTYTGSVAEDEYGSILVKAAEKEGLSMPMYITKEAGTGTCAVCIVDKERSLVANLAAACKFGHEHMKTEAVEKAMTGAGVYYIAGFFLTTCAPALMTVAEHANAEGKVFTMNLSAPFIIDFFTEPLKAALQYVDILFGNETEAKALAAKEGWDTEDVKEIAVKAQAMEKKGKARTVVFTQGSLCTVVATEGGVETFAVEKVEKVVDTNGAGDSFVGGFLAQYCKGADMKTCIETGHKAAGRIIQTSGCQFEGAF